MDRKLRTDRGGPPEAVLRRLVGMLARKGYPPGLAVSVVVVIVALPLAAIAAASYLAGGIAVAMTRLLRRSARAAACSLRRAAASLARTS